MKLRVFGYREVCVLIYEGCVNEQSLFTEHLHAFVSVLSFVVDTK